VSERASKQQTDSEKSFSWLVSRWHLHQDSSPGHGDGLARYSHGMGMAAWRLHLLLFYPIAWIAAVVVV